MKKILPWILPLFRTGLFFMGGWIFIIVTKQTYEQAMNWWSLLCTLFNLITIFVLMLVCRYEGIKFKSLYHKNGKKLKFKSTFIFTILMLMIGVGGMLTFSFIFYKGLPEFLILPIPIWIAVINLFLLPISIVFAELPLYFGYALDRINQQTGKPVVAIIYTVFFYALQHSFIPLLFDYKYMIFRFLSFLPLMIFLGISYYRHKNIKEMMVGHGIMDLSTGMQILIMSFL